MELAAQKEEKEARREEILQRRLREVESPNSIVLAPRTREGHVLARLTYGLDRAVGRIRSRAGTFLGVQEAVGQLRKVEGFVKQFKDFVDSAIGTDSKFFLGIMQEDPETKRMMAQMRNSYVLVPRSNEAREIAYLIKRLDPALVQFRATCSDFTRTEDFFKRLVELICAFDSLVGEISGAVNVPYRQPRDLAPIQKANSGPVDQADPPNQVEESSPGKKGKK